IVAPNINVRGVERAGPHQKAGRNWGRSTSGAGVVADVQFVDQGIERSGRRVERGDTRVSLAAAVDFANGKFIDARYGVSAANLNCRAGQPGLKIERATRAVSTNQDRIRVERIGLAKSQRTSVADRR